MHKSYSKEALGSLLRDFTLKDWLETFSKDTWARLDFSRSWRKEIKTYETTLTQNLIYQLWRIARITENPQIRILESRNETANGNDIEIFVQRDSHYIFFPTQAKSIYPSGRYDKMGYRVKGVPQIQLLLDYAAKKGGIPLYLLYNYSSDFDRIMLLKEKITFDYEYFGCSLVNGHYLWRHFLREEEVRRRLPGFYDLHPTPAIPLFKIAEIGINDKILTHLREESRQFVPHLSHYNKTDIIDTENWIDRTPPPHAIGRTTTDLEQLVSGTTSDSLRFHPKYRIVFSSSSIDNRRGTRIDYIH